MSKPLLLISSSEESLDLAYALQKNLEESADVLVWREGLFDFTKSFLESLLDKLEECQFGLFVFTPDDVTTIRNREVRTVRDNVVFELGLFLGRWGPDRTFILRPKGVESFKLPTDLLGIHTATFSPPQDPERLPSALEPACRQIGRAIQKIWKPPPEVEVASAGALDLENLILTEPHRKHLTNLAKGQTRYTGRGSLRSEIRELRSRGLLEMRPGKAVADMKSGQKFNLVDYVILTENGRNLAKRLSS